MHEPFSLRRRARIVTSQRGTASIEALLVITSFVLLWAGVQHLGRMSVLEQQARSEARSCAFLMASQSCQEVPAHCTGETHEAAPSEEAQTLRDATKRGTEEAEDAEPIQETLDAQVDAGFFRRARASAGSRLRRPLQLGEEEVRIAEDFSLPCDPKPGTLGDRLKDTFREMFDQMKSDDAADTEGR